MQNPVRGALGVAALSSLVGACNEAAPAAGAKAPESGSRSQRLENGVNVIETDASGAPSFIGGDLGTLPVIDAVGADLCRPRRLGRR